MRQDVTSEGDGRYLDSSKNRAASWFASVPVDWFPWLAAGSVVQQHDLRLVEGGTGIWWEQLEDGVSVPGLLGLPE